MRRLALLALVLPLAACGGGGKKAAAPVLSGAPGSVVKGSAAKTAASPSEHVVMTAAATLAGTSVTIDGNGDFDNTHRRGLLHATVDATGVNVAIDEVLNRATIYVRSPLLARGLPHGKSWIKLDLQTVGKANGVDFSALMGQSPAQSFAQLEAARSVTRVGGETVDGVATTHYRARIDASKLPQEAQLRALTHAKYGPLDIWVGNSDGYIHRYELSYTLTEHGQRVSMTLTMDLSKYGESVTVRLPPASQVVDGTGAALKGITA